MIRADARSGGAVLVVEDEPDIRDLIVREVQQMGLRPLPCPSARAALMETEPLQLALIDILLPDRSGTKVARELRSRESTARVPVIFVTILDQVTDIEDLDPPALVVHKPFKRVHLRSAIENALADAVHG